MIYAQHRPHATLRQYIDAYWTVRHDAGGRHSNRIMPDGCVDIIINRGEKFRYGHRQEILNPDRVALVGTMTKYIDSASHVGTHLIGIRFKPLGFRAFYEFGSMHEVSNITVQCDLSVPDVHVLNNAGIQMLDLFFLRKLRNDYNRMTEVLCEIEQHVGDVTVHQLSTRYGFGSRQMERDFRYYLGVSPKEYLNFKRYERARDAIRRSRHQRSLLDIALEIGYYDHAHMTNEIKKHSGSTPSLI